MAYNIKGECRNTGRTHFKKGVSGFRRKHSEESKNKLSKSMSNRIAEGWIPPLTGKKHSVESIQRIKEARKNQKNLKLDNCKGKPWSEARREAQKIVKRKIIVKIKPIVRKGREYHPAWNEIRKFIYKRDNWVCQSCDKKLGRKIGIACHHVDYDTTNNDPKNLVSLCCSCHAKTNFKRLDWMVYFSKDNGMA